MKNIKWLFFDVGSTLVDETECYKKRLSCIADSANIPYEKICEEAIEFYKDNKKGDLELTKKYNVELPPWYAEGEKLYADVIICLSRLHSKYKIGVIANQNPGTKERLERYGIIKYIDLIVASAEEGVAKPDKKIFEIALERAGCNPKESVMIGDRIDNDIVPAKKIGMRTIWIKQGFGKYWNIKKDSEQPDMIVQNLTHLCDEVAKW